MYCYSIIYTLPVLWTLAASALRHGSIIPDSHIIELHDDHDLNAGIEHFSGQATIRQVFNHTLFRGFSIQFSRGSRTRRQVRDLAGMPAVKGIWPVQILQTESIDPASLIPDQMHASDSARLLLRRAGNGPYEPHAMTQVDKLHAIGIWGKGIKVAMVDSGIDYRHPYLGGCFGRGCLVSFGTDLVGDDFTGDNSPVPDGDPMDCSGHGTLMAGIIAARRSSLGFQGVAPGVKLGAYRVMGCSGKTNSAMVLSALLAAYADGAKVITASIEGSGGWCQGPCAKLIRRIERRGVPCLFSAGNTGGRGQFYLTSGGRGHGALTIASFDNVVKPSIRVTASYSLLSSDPWYRKCGTCLSLASLRRAREFTCAIGRIAGWDGAPMPLYATSLNVSVADDACEALPDTVPNLDKFIVLVQEGGCQRQRKVLNLIAKGARHVLFYVEAGGEDLRPPSGLRGVQITAVAAVSRTLALEWVQALSDGVRVMVSVPNPGRLSHVQVVSSDNEATGGAPSLSTAWGPAYDLEVRPQFGAPGGYLLSTNRVVMGSFALSGGTSSACAFAAGIVALVLDARKGDPPDPASLTNLLSTTAAPQPETDGFQLGGYLAPVSQQGAGLMQAFDAAFALTIISPASLAFNDSDRIKPSAHFTVVNKSKATIKYSISHTPARTRYTLGKDSIYPMQFPNEKLRVYASLTFTRDDQSSRVFILQPDEEATIEVTPTLPDTLDARRLAVWSGYLTIEGNDGSTFTMPYLGVTGSLRRTTVLAPDQAWMSTVEAEGESPPKAAPDTVFKVPGPNGARCAEHTAPALYAKLAFGSPCVRAELVPLTDDGASRPALGQLKGFPDKWVPRELLQQEWDGRLRNREHAPPGRYKIVVKALRVFGNASNEADWDTAETHPFILEHAGC